MQWNMGADGLVCQVRYACQQDALMPVENGGGEVKHRCASVYT